MDKFFTSLAKSLLSILCSSGFVPMFPRNYSLKIRLAQGSKRGILLLLVISAVWVSRVNSLFAADSTDHPFVETKDLKPETCLKCHPTKNQGKFVHTAVGMGCENCHTTTSADNKTTITLTATGGDLCAMCHEANKDPVQHEPFKAGQCLICHDPHTGDYKAQTRAPVNTLCFSCHGENSPNVKVNNETKLVAMLGGQVMSLEEYRQAPKLGLDPGGTSGHPLMGHPLTGKDPHIKGGVMSCLTCHNQHSSALPKLMPAGVKSQQELCMECHK
jgi:predicted CXXCH cytochrome family protein